MKTKRCPKCNKRRLRKFFNKRITAKDGLRSACKNCEAKNCKKYYTENKDMIIEWKNKNITKIQEYQKRYYPKYREKNKEKIQQYKKRYQIINRTKISKQLNNRYKKDLSYRIKQNMRTRLNLAIKNNSKYSSTIDLLGCSIEKFKLYIERKFQHGMTWDNYGKDGWHIDHIIPCSNFDLSKKDEQQICFNYKNLQPLWAKDNLSKGDKVIC